MFCYPCRHFTILPENASHPDITFTTLGFNSWKNALEKQKGFHRHEKSATHVAAVTAMNEKKHRQESGATVSELLSKNVLELRRYYVQSIIDIVIFLATNELAFRGNWQKNERRESGLFQSLFDYTLKKDEKLQKAVNLIPKNATYTSAAIQNTLISILADCTRQSIIKKVNASPYMTLLVDGTKDLNGTECVSIAARYIENGKACESLLAIETADDLTAEGLCAVILKALEDYGVDTTKIISQCYDGAAVMSGNKGGIQTLLQTKLGRMIPYVHCFSHRLHLALIELCKKVGLIRIFFEQTRTIYNLFTHYKVKKVYEGSTLKRLIDTRWTGHYRATLAIFENYDEIIKALKEIKPKTPHNFETDDIIVARGILNFISSLEFVYIMVFMKDILEIIKPADAILQSREMSYSTGMPVIDAVKDEILSYRSEEKFNEIKEKASKCLPDELPPPRALGARKRRRSTLLNDSVVTETLGERSTTEIAIKSAFFEVIDILVAEMRKRFDENNEVLIALSAADKMKEEELKPLEALEGIKVPTQIQLNLAKRVILKDANDLNLNSKLILDRIFPHQVGFPDVYRFYCAIQAFGCSTAINECSFSSLARIGILPRISMASKRLRDLTFLAFESKELQAIPVESILRTFNNDKKRRLQLY